MFLTFIKQYLKQTKIIYLYLFVLASVNLLQAVFTDLGDDECYYYDAYSNHLNWGYFDHPPAVAVFIKIGVWLFGKTPLGIRFMSILSMLIMQLLLFKLINNEKKQYFQYVFVLLCLSSLICNIFGFIIGPDVPLLLFSLLFIAFIPHYLQKQNIVNIIILGLSMSLIMYSKYIGILTIVFALLPHIKKLWNKYFLFSILIALLFYTPHLIWLWQNDWVTIKFHLFQRNANINFKDNYEAVWMNLLNIVFVIGVILFPVLIFVFIKNQFLDPLTRSFESIILGYIIFFVALSFNSWIELHWLSIITFASIFLIYNYVINHYHIHKYIIWNGSLSIIAIIFIRICLFYDILDIDTEYHKKVDEVKFINNIIDNKPVIFINNYHRAAKFNTYNTSNYSTSLACLDHRQSQYTLLNPLDKFNYAPVWIFSNHPFQDAFEIKYKYNFKTYCIYVPHFINWKNTFIFYDKNISKDNEFVIIKGNINLNKKNENFFQAHTIKMIALDDLNKHIATLPIENITYTQSDKQYIISVKIKKEIFDTIKTKSTNKKYYFSIPQNGFIVHINSNSLEF